MAGPRIRTLKPEWLEDEQLLRVGSHARVLSVALILVADDYGRGRCIPEALAAQVFPFERESSRVFRESLARLSGMGFVGVYVVRGQQYFELRNWTKHQRVDKPGKPRVPAPNPSDFIELELSRDPREEVANDSRGSRESLAPDRDLDQDLDQEGEARARAIPPPPVATQGHTHEAATNGLVDDLGDPWDAPIPLKPCWRLWRIWEEVAGEGADTCGDRKPYAASLTVTYGSLEKRRPQDPEGLFRSMTEAYVAQRRAEGKRLDLKWFLADFSGWVEVVRGANGNHVARAMQSAPPSNRAERKPMTPMPTVKREPTEVPK